jgi:WD40 repeat protein
VIAAAFSPDGRQVVTASDDKTARIWSAADGTPIAELKGHTHSVRSAAFSPDGRQVVTASDDKTARIWSAADGTPIAELKWHAAPVIAAAFSPDGKLIVTISYDKTASVWPLEPLIKGKAVTIPLWVQAFTGTELQGGVIRHLSDAEWKARCRELRAYGTKAPPSRWLEGLDLAERSARP